MNGNWLVEKIPILQDNFVFVIHKGQDAIVVDPGESEPVLDFLKSHSLSCRIILITHHHSDHIHGLADIREKYDSFVYAPLKNQKQIPFGVTNYVQAGEKIHFEDLEFQVLEMPGHTLGHVAYWEPEKKWLFSGDVLFALGCGRLFEGSFEQMFETLQKVNSLPTGTSVFCTHDYLSRNQKFCEQEGLRTEGYQNLLPLSLDQEKLFNPFLRAASLEEFRHLREKRNQF